MTTLTLGPVIGKIGGGAEVQKIPINFTVPGQGTNTFHTVEVPEGETWLIAVSGLMSPGSSETSLEPSLSLGEMTSRVRNPGFWAGLAGEFEAGPVTMSITEPSGVYRSSFEGAVWIVPLP